jgi:hypothetical protein
MLLRFSQEKKFEILKIRAQGERLDQLLSRLADVAAVAELTARLSGTS